MFASEKLNNDSTFDQNVAAKKKWQILSNVTTFRGPQKQTKINSMKFRAIGRNKANRHNKAEKVYQQNTVISIGK